MTARIPVVYVDDPDAAIAYDVTNTAGASLTFDPKVALGDGDYTITGTWEGDPATTRRLRIPMAAAIADQTVRSATYKVYLQNPNGADLLLGYVQVNRR